MERSDIQVLIDAIATGVPNTALKVRDVLNAIADGTAQTGDTKEIDVSNAYLNANFDITGLGTNERLGWAICNGQNGTRNRSGRVAMGYDATNYPTLGATGGEKEHVLTVNEMPAHNHTFSSSAAGESGGGYVTTGTSNEAAGTFGMQNTGGGLAHNNLQPYMVTLVIMKL